MKQVWAVLLRAFPDIQVAGADVIAEGDKLACRNVGTGTHLGEYLGLAPTIGRPLRFEEVPREQFRDQMLRHGMQAPVVDQLFDGLAARDGKTAETTSAVEQVTGRPAFTYAQWVRAHPAWAFGERG